MNRIETQWRPYKLPTCHYSTFTSFACYNVWRPRKATPPFSRGYRVCFSLPWQPRGWGFGTIKSQYTAGLTFQNNMRMILLTLTLGLGIYIFKSAKLPPLPGRGARGWVPGKSFRTGLFLEGSPWKSGSKFKSYFLERLDLEIYSYTGARGKRHE